MIFGVPELGECCHPVGSESTSWEKPYLEVRLRCVLVSGGADEGPVVASDRGELAPAPGEPLENRNGIVELGPLDPELGGDGDALLWSLERQHGSGVVLEILSDPW